MRKGTGHIAGSEAAEVALFFVLAYCLTNNLHFVHLFITFYSSLSKHTKLAAQSEMRSQTFIIGLNSFSNQLLCLALFEKYIFRSTILLKVAKLQYFSLAPFCQI